MDILDKLINLAQLTGGVNINCQLQGDWKLDNPSMAFGAVAHIVNHGQAFVHVDNTGQTTQVSAGDIVFFSNGLAHSLSSDHTPKGVYPTPILSREGQFTVAKVGDGNMGRACDLFCLHFHYDGQSELFKNLPPMLILHTAGTPLQAIITLLKSEALSKDLGASSVINALTSLIFTLIMRTFLNQEMQNKDSAVLGILKGLQEPRLHGLLSAIIQNPQHDWQIETMANKAHLSRSQLIRLFNQHLGVSPHAFVHKIRLQKSAMLLKQSADSVLSIALSVGFLSETHFSKAFKKLYGTSPSSYRMPAL